MPDLRVGHTFPSGLPAPQFKISLDKYLPSASDIEVATASGCYAGAPSLCSCSELVSKGVIKSIDDCTMSAAVKACQSGACSHSGLPEAQQVEQAK